MASRTPNRPPIGRNNTPRLSPAAYLNSKLDHIRKTHGVPALAAVLVRDGGDTVLGLAIGQRKSDLAATASANVVQQTDRFCIGSVSKPFTGYLMARLVQQRSDLAWTTRIRDVFPEMTSEAFRTRYRIRASYLDRTLEQLMSHSADLPYAPVNGFEMTVNRTGLSGAFRTEYATADSLAVRRYNYVLTSLQDEPVPSPGSSIVYGGGCIIAAAMAERLTGRSYEQLMRDEVFEPLGMSRSGLGRLATNSTPDGLWEHNSNPSTGAITPDATAIELVENFHSHGPAGAIHSTHADMARFITANLSESGKPKSVVNDATLRQSHERPDAGESTFTRAGWQRTGSGTSFCVKHNGDNCRSRAELRVFPGENHGYAAMTNVSNGCADGAHIGADAVAATLSLLKQMNDEWETLF